MTECENTSVMFCPLLILLGLLSYILLVYDVKVALSSLFSTDKIDYDWIMFDFFRLRISYLWVEPLMFWLKEIVANSAGDIPSYTDMKCLALVLVISCILIQIKLLLVGS